jgi:hypothetical protein
MTEFYLNFTVLHFALEDKTFIPRYLALSIAGSAITYVWCLHTTTAETQLLL